MVFVGAGAGAGAGAAQDITRGTIISIAVNTQINGFFNFLISLII
jgi:hypothetical protein